MGNEDWDADWKHCWASPWETMMPAMMAVLAMLAWRTPKDLLRPAARGLGSFS